MLANQHYEFVVGQGKLNISSEMKINFSRFMKSFLDEYYDESKVRPFLPFQGVSPTPPQMFSECRLRNMLAGKRGSGADQPEDVLSYSTGFRYCCCFKKM